MNQKLLNVLRMRRGLSENDSSQDTELLSLSADTKLHEICAWQFGDPIWADEFLSWADECGYEVTLKKKALSPQTLRGST